VGIYHACALCAVASRAERLGSLDILTLGALANDRLGHKAREADEGSDGLVGKSQRDFSLSLKWLSGPRTLKKTVNLWRDYWHICITPSPAWHALCEKLTTDSIFNPTTRIYAVKFMMPQ